jgi:hypothetical protein
MAAGNTARIDITTFRAEWASHLPIRVLCERWTITRDQVTRLKWVWNLPPRHDRRLRAKPQRQPPPTPEEIAASRASLSLAPAIAARVTCVQITWDERTRQERQVSKPGILTVKHLPVPEEARDFLDDMNREAGL